MAHDYETIVRHRLNRIREAHDIAVNIKHTSILHHINNSETIVVSLPHYYQISEPKSIYIGLQDYYILI